MTPQPRADHGDTFMGHHHPDGCEHPEPRADHPAEDRLAGIAGRHYQSGVRHALDGDHPLCACTLSWPCDAAHLLSLLTERTADVLAAVNLYEETRAERDAAREDADRLAEALERCKAHLVPGMVTIRAIKAADAALAAHRGSGLCDCGYPEYKHPKSAHRGSGEARDDG